MLYYQKYNQTKQMSPAFKSLSYKADRNEKYLVKETSKGTSKETSKETSNVFEKLNSKPDPYFKSLMHQTTAKKEDLKDLMYQSTAKKEFKSKVFGAILRYRSPHTHITKYALVQGRYTGKWSFPKGHSLPDEELVVVVAVAILSL